MNIRKTIITAIVGLTLVATIVPVSNVSALTVDEMMAQINLLTAQIAQLQGTTPSVSSGSPAVCAGITFTRNMTTGATGSDVKCLQALLNQSASTQVSTTGAGSPGNETTYFGPRTLVAVRVFQSENGMTPAGQVGPMTRAKLNQMLAGSIIDPGLPPVVPPPPATTGPVSATLSSTTPAASSFINSQATAGLLDINFAGNGTVTSVTLQRSGISTQSTLSNVYLFDGNTRITDGYSFNVNGQLVINGLSINVVGSKVISVKADVAGDALTYASSIAATLTSYTANGTTSTANVVGNTMMIVTGQAATVNLSANTVTTANVNAGTTGYTFWSAPIQINTRTVVLKTANFRMIGSAPSDALSNIKMYIDGVDTGRTATVISITGSNYLSFDLTSSPINLATGSHTVDLRADVQKGTYRNVTVSVQQASDLTITDPQMNVNIAVGGTVPNNAGTISILTGSATTVVDPTFNSATNVSAGASNVVIGKFKLHAYGEDIKTNTLVVTPLVKSATTTGATCTTDASGTTVAGACGLNNVTLYFNGSQIGSQVNWTHAQMLAATPITFTLGSQMIIPAGQDSTLEIRADLQTANSVSYTGGTVQVTLVGDTDNATGQSSSNSVGVPATSNISTTGLDIASASLAVSKNSAYLNQAISPNTAGVKIGSYILQNQSTSEAVRITSYSVVTTNSGTLGINNLSALRTSDVTGSGSTPIQPTGTDTFSVNNIMQPGASMILDIFANTGGDTSGTVLTTLNVSSLGAVSNISATSGIKTGQSLTLGNGTVANPPTLVVSSTTPAQYIAAAGGATNATQAAFNFVSTSGASTITELKFTVTGTDANPSQTVTNICVGSVCAQPVAGVANLTGLTLAVPNGGGGLTQNVQVSYSSVGTGGITPGSTSTVSLTYVKYTSGGTTATFSPAVSATAMILVGSKPTVVVTNTQATGLNYGGVENKIGEVTVTADAKGNIKLNDIKFSVSASGFTTNPTYTLARIADGSTTVTGSSCGQGTAANASQTIFCEFGTGTLVTITGVADVEDNTDFDGYSIAAGTSKTFSLYATVSGADTGTATQTISTSLVAAGFNWDDVSSNGEAGSYNLTGSSIYNFPTNGYSIRD